MKKVILFVLMIVSASFIHGQSVEKQQVIVKSEMKKLTRLVSLGNENLSFSKNQTAKLKGVFADKANEIIKLRSKDLEKLAYVKAHNKIDDKYLPRIEKVLSTEQKVAYRRNKSQKRSL